MFLELHSRPENRCLRLVDMHALMSFVGALMAESGLSDVLLEVFGGASKMLSGKKFPQNVRALRMLTEEVLRGLFTIRLLKALMTS